MIDISMLSTQYDVRRLHDSDVDAILDFYRENTLYYQFCGAEASREQILIDLHITPPGVNRSAKYYVGFYRDEELVAVMDLIEGYPDLNTCFIGFFMVNASHQGKNTGTGIIQDVFAYLRQLGKTSVRLGIAEGNPQAGHFWKKNGFTVIGKVPMDGWTALVAEKKLQDYSE